VTLLLPGIENNLYMQIGSVLLIALSARQSRHEAGGGQITFRPCVGHNLVALDWLC